ncbi:MAG: hypothetical protein ACRDKL_09195 [Solirubrobacteraceae bacterium]
MTAGAALLSACGSSSLTKADYNVKANAICRTAGSKTGPLITRLTAAAESLMSSGGHSASPALIGELRQLHGTAASTLAKLRALKPPTSGRIDQFLTPFATVTAALGHATEDAGAGRLQKALLEMEAVAPTSQRMTSAAKAAGLTACANALAAVP